MGEFEYCWGYNAMYLSLQHNAIGKKGAVTLIQTGLPLISVITNNKNTPWILHCHRTIFVLRKIIIGALILTDSAKIRISKLEDL